MVQRTLRRFASAADLLRPTTFFRALARVDQLVDATRDLEASVEALRIKTERLETIARLDWEAHQDVERLPQILDAARIARHVERAVSGAPLSCDPFPHLVVDDWLPHDVYRVVVRAVPPSVFFAAREEARQRLTVPFGHAPVYSRLVWQFVAEEIVGRILSDAVNRKFASIIADYVRGICGDDDLGDLDLTLHPSDGRIMLRRPGYVIPPHRDPKWGFVTGLVYLAKPGDNEAFGTNLYRVRDDRSAPNDKPYYVDESKCELVRAVPFRANTMLAFLNSAGAHGASIPADAQPPTLERYVYQFRLGPDTAAIKQLLSRMPPDQRDTWSGAKAHKASAGH